MKKRAHCHKKQRKKKRKFDKQIAQGWSFLKYSKKFIIENIFLKRQNFLFDKK